MMRPGAGRLSRRLVPSVLILALAGCSGLLGAKEPAQLYRVTPKSTFPANLPHRSVQILIDVPLSPSGLDSSQIALTRSAVSIDYYADSEWTERVPLLVQTALLQSFENSKAINAIDREFARAASGFHPQNRVAAFRSGVRFVQRSTRDLGLDQCPACRPHRARYHRANLVRAASEGRGEQYARYHLGLRQGPRRGAQGYRRVDRHQSRFVDEARLSYPGRVLFA